MKNLYSSNYFIKGILLLFMFIMFVQQSYSQTFCNTPPSSAYSNYDFSMRTMNEPGPFYLRIYVHVIRQTNGTGGQTVPNVYEALSYLDRDYNPHNIFFIWDCNIDYIDNDTYYNTTGTSAIFNVNKHTDGIDIYLFRDQPPPNATGNGLAANIGATAFYVFGNFWNPPYNPLVRSHVISHEMGHCINLWHPWQGPNGCQEFVDGSNCDICGDLICDSPADPPGGVNFNVNPQTCTWNGSGNDPHGDPYNPDEHIIMEYTIPDCMEYFTLGQGQRMRNAIASLPILQNCIVPNCEQVITGTNVIWSTPMEIKGNLIIENGAKLTITNTVSFYPQSSVIVKIGGKLVVNGGTLTNVADLCHGNRMWQGVQVWGNRNAHQYLISGQYQQGYIELTNATIQNAICAVDLWKPDDYFATGGIIKATNSSFINNTRAIHALFYKNFHPYNGQETNYNATINNCTFNITSSYLAIKTFYKHIDLTCVRGFSFSGCDFNLSPNVSGVSEWNQAIASYSSGFYSSGRCTSPGNIYPCTSYDPTTYNGFRWGIYASNDFLTPYTFNVSRSNFDNNVYGISASAVKNESVIFSNFNVGYNNTPGCSASSGYGIFLDHSSGFAIEENSFTKMAGAPQSYYTGISTNFTESVDEIYKNSFNGLSYANYAFGSNILNDFLTQGLAYYCNTNQNNYADFFAPDQLTYALQAFQGDPQHPTGNTFSSNATWHFYNGTPTLVGYYYNVNSPVQVPDLSKLHGVAAVPVNLVNQCPTHYGNTAITQAIVLSDQEKTAREQQFSIALNNYNNVKTLYDNLKDGGSTEQKLIDIATAQPQDMWSLRTELLGASPHLTEDVLKQVADKTSVFSEAAIFDILAANPDELKKEELIKYLEEKENPLPSYMIEILRQVAAGTTYKTVLQQEMSRYNREKTRAANDMIRSYLNDTIMDNNALRNWYDNLGGIGADKQIISSYIHEGNFNAAFSLANMLPQLYYLQGDDLIEHERFMQILYLHQTLHNDGRVMAQLNNSEKTMLENMANESNGTSGAIAKGILTHFYGANFIDCLETGNSSAYKSGKISPESLAKIYGMEISVKPNPASTWAAFDYKLPDENPNALLTITDLSGREVSVLELNDKQGQKLFDTRPLPSGTYIYTLKSGNKQLTGKLTVVK